MKYIEIFEKFSEDKYLKTKGKKQKKLTQKVGDKFIKDIIIEGDFDGLNYLLNAGYNLSKSLPDENLITVALQNNQLEMLDYLLKSDYITDLDWGNPINCVILSDIVQKDNSYFGDNKPKNTTKIKPEQIEQLKTLANYGYSFGGQYNLIELYLTENTYRMNGKNEHKIIEGLEPFIDWLLENYPANYPLCKKFLPDYLRKKYNYLEEGGKYNL